MTETAVAATAQHYEVVIGLEVHAQLLTKSKMFCACSTDYEQAGPNANTCPVCLGLPGTLPVANQTAVEYTIRTALALNCEIPSFSKFDRKNYFYPDLPKGYQISQFDLPLSLNGHLEVGSGEDVLRAGITRVHLEEDTGTMLHAGGVLQSASSSLIDLNRAGVPLMEIVGEPDLRTPEQAREYLHKLRQILVYLGVSDGNLESGSFRCDANISLRPVGSVDLGVKVEVKNMNSFRAVQKALEFEIDRQTGMLQAGETIDQETRGWVEGQMATVSQRGKEHAHDYRYFPEPDLPPLEVSREMVDEIRGRLPELPEAKQKRFASQYNLSDYDASVLTQSKGTADAFEEVAKKVAAKVAANWLMGDVARISNETATELLQSGLGVSGLVALLDLVEKGSINSATAKTLLDELYVKGGDPATIVAQRGLAQVSDEGELSKLVDDVITAHANVVADYKGGKQQALQALVGQIMKATKGRANAQAVSQLLRERLDN